MTRIEKIRKTAIKEKAAKLLGCKVSQIRNVEETYDGAGAALTNGNHLLIPYEVWVLGWTEQEYIASRRG